ncbi:hypothetical protein GGR52DRAFT_592020 [Hypoxylon sp. FL1284]|nr:hypothetical protein GGR52DRAFT_592020 [Hypoxylon sp. FL1284]
MKTGNSTEPSPASPVSQDHDETIISTSSSTKAQDITDLPNDLFLLVTSHLSPQDCVLGRRVSRAWRDAFGSADASRTFMRWHFSRAREMRAGAAEELGEAPDWPRIFAGVARRYYHLRAAKPWRVDKIDVAQEATGGSGGEGGGAFRSVAPWARWLQWNDSVAALQHRDPTWCVDDGLLVYQEPGSMRHVARDLATGRRFPVPFDGSDKTVRRLRLACGVLVFEWCEREPYHQLNDRETVHRHFATAFDVQRHYDHQKVDSEPRRLTGTSWDVAFRSEWKIHFLGLPLNNRDRFFSAHTASHYALYLWQPNRSPWGEDDPLEQLIVWDISAPCAYRPSLDPTGAGKPAATRNGDDSSASGEPSSSSSAGPAVVRRFTWRDLEFLGLRQRQTPTLRGVRLDGANVYVHEEDHRWVAGRHSSLSPPRHHVVRCTGVPFSSAGPRWFDECCADGDVHMSFCPRPGSPSSSSSSAATSRPARAPCWRHEDFPYLTVADVVDAAAGVRVVARQCFMVEALSAFVLPRLSVEEEKRGEGGGGAEEGEEEEADDGGGEEEGAGQQQPQSEVRFADDMWWELLARGCIAGDERWVVGEDRDGRVTVVRF